MKKLLLPAVVIVALHTPGAWAQEGETPAVITTLEFSISRLSATGYAASAPFDPLNEVAREGDFIRVEVTFDDEDIVAGQGDDDPEYFERKQSYGVAAGLGLTFTGFGSGAGFLEGVSLAVVSFYADESSPSAPPIEGEDADFSPPGRLTLDTAAGTGTYYYYYEIPELNGPSQARLREPDVYDYDVTYWTRLELSETESPGEDDFVSIVWYAIDVVENPVLRPENPPPFSDAGRDQIVALNEDTGTVTVTLDGTRTFDAYNLGFENNDPDVFEKDDLEYVWEWIAGPERTNPTPIDGEPGKSRVTLGLPTSSDNPYIFRLLVTDGANAVPTSDVVRVHVRSSAPVNNAPVAIVQGPAEAVAVGAEITLDGSDTFDPDGDTLEYRWQQTNEVGGELSETQIRAAFQPLSGLNDVTSKWRATTEGTFYFRLYVNDVPVERDTALAGEQLSDVATITVTVSGTSAGADSQAGLSPSGENGGFANDALPLVMPCGAGIAPLAFLPLMLWPLRGRLR